MHTISTGAHQTITSRAIVGQISICLCNGRASGWDRTCRTPSQHGRSALFLFQPGEEGTSGPVYLPIASASQVPQFHHCKDNLFEPIAVMKKSVTMLFGLPCGDRESVGWKVGRVQYYQQARLDTLSEGYPWPLL